MRQFASNATVFLLGKLCSDFWLFLSLGKGVENWYFMCYRMKWYIALIWLSPYVTNNEGEMFLHHLTENDRSTNCITQIFACTIFSFFFVFGRPLCFLMSHKRAFQLIKMMRHSNLIISIVPEQWAPTYGWTCILPTNKTISSIQRILFFKELTLS